MSTDEKADERIVIHIGTGADGQRRSSVDDWKHTVIVLVMTIGVVRVYTPLIFLIPLVIMVGILVTSRAVSAYDAGELKVTAPVLSVMYVIGTTIYAVMMYDCCLQTVLPYGPIFGMRPDRWARMLFTLSLGVPVWLGRRLLRLLRCSPRPASLNIRVRYPAEVLPFP